MYGEQQLTLSGIYESVSDVQNKNVTEVNVKKARNRELERDA